MRKDDRHVREIDRYIVDVNRIAIFQSHTPASAHTRADPAVARVKNDRQPRLGDDFIEGICNPVVCVELLHRWMEFEAASTCCNQAASLGYSVGATGGIHAGKRNHDV